MANNALTEYLQFHGQEKKSGCLAVSYQGNEGRIYFQRGAVVYAETSGGVGIFALFLMLGWAGDVAFNWKEDAPAPKMAFSEAVDALLFQYAQLEDSGQTDENTLKALFPDSQSRDMNLNELKSYLVTFEILNTEYSGAVFTLSKPATVVGRGEDCDFVIPDSTVSSRHATISQEANCIRIVDLGSTNGTYINRNLVTDSIIQVGDEIALGQVSLRMFMRMDRHLAIPGDSGAQTAPSSPNHDRDAARKSSTLKIDSELLRKRLEDSGYSGRPKGPITWKNLEEIEKTRPISISLFSKLFNKK